MRGTFPFTYQGYAEMIFLLQQNGYEISDYHKWEDVEKPVILRHDIDNSPEKALQLARLENKLSVRSTYFVLLTSDFYNVFSKHTEDALREIAKQGHEIGLHFDEKRYPEVFGKPDECIEYVLKEARILQDALGFPITTVSMHRPSKMMLDANLEIPAMVNSYGTTFFHTFKYLSDSRHCWREPVADIISSKQYPRLHILTHAISWDERPMDIDQWAEELMCRRMLRQWDILNENFSDLESVLPYHEVCTWIEKRNEAKE